jgi:ribonucrease Y
MATRAAWLPWRRRQSSQPSESRAHVRPEPPAKSSDDELRARRDEIARMEERALRQSESLEVKTTDLERRLQAVSDRERNVAQQSEELKQAKRVQRRELERISSLSASQARQLLLAEVEQEARHQAGLRLQEIEEETRREAERRARHIRTRTPSTPHPPPPHPGRATSSRWRCSGWPRRHRPNPRRDSLSFPATR